MAKLEIKYSSAQIKKPSVPSAEGIKIDPYYYSVAGADNAIFFGHNF